MTHLSETGGGDGASGARALTRALLSRFESLVSPMVLSPAERSAQARTIGRLVCVGLVASLVATFAGLAELGLGAVLLPTMVAGLCLALAGLLAASGRHELVLLLGCAAAAGLLAVVATRSGGMASSFLLLLLVPPIEAAVAGRRTLAGFAAGFGSLAVGAVGLADWAGPAASAHQPYAGPAMLAVGGLYAAHILRRLMRVRAAGRSERDVEAVEARLVEDMLSDAVLRFSPEGRLVSASKSAETIFGNLGGGQGGGGQVSEKGGDRAGRDAEARLFQSIHLTDRVGYLKAFGELRAGASRQTVEVRVHGEAGSGEGVKDVVMQLVAVRTKDVASAVPAGPLSGILCIARDVTAERMRTAEMEGALDEAKRGSDAKSHFLASISHELRTPLNAIIGFSDVLDQEFFGGFENPRQKEYVGLIRQSGEHLLQVVNGLLDISKIEAGRYELLLEPFVIEDALLSAVEVMRPEAERKGLSLDVATQCAGAGIVADRRAFHQVLLNLLSNAVKFTDAGTIAVTAEIAAGLVVMTVRDTGIGIARADLSKLGTPFTQVSTGLARRYGGTGLGLSLVKGLCEMHHGALAITSEPGRGTSVTVSIPLDCALKIADQESSNENVVALPHARKKTDSSSQARPAARRTA